MSDYVGMRLVEQAKRIVELERLVASLQAEITELKKEKQNE